MTSAARIYRLNLALTTLGAGAVLIAAAAAASSVTLTPAASGAVADVCQRLLGLHIAVGAALTALLASVVAISLSRAVLATCRELRAQRRVRVALARLTTATRSDRSVVIAGDEAHAFCAGFLRPRVYVTTRAVDALSVDQLSAVIAHEEHHRRRRDPLRFALLRIGAEAFFFLPALGAAAARYEALAELAADDAAVRSVGRPAVAGALVAFGSRSDSPVLDGIHPERVDHLLGGRPRTGLRLSALLSSLATAFAIAFAAASSAAAGATLEVGRLAADTCAAATTLAVPGMLVLGLAWSRQRARRLPI